MRRFIFFLTVIVLVLGTAYYFWRTYPYSDGSRTGYLVKLSSRGYLFKTMEGQLNLGGAENGMLEMWEFSVRDEAIYQELQQLEGQKVRVEYEEVNNAFFWMGDTNYFITSAEVKQ